MAQLLKRLREGQEACTDVGCETTTQQGLSTLTVVFMWLVLMAAFLVLRPNNKRTTLALDSKPFRGAREEPPPPPPATGSA